MCRPSEWELELLKKHAGCMLRKCDRIEEVILVFLAFDLYSVLWHTIHFWGIFNIKYVIEALQLHLHVYFLAFRPISMNQCNSRCRNVFRNLETNFYRETNLTVWTWLTAASVVTVSQRKNLVNPPPHLLIRIAPYDEKATVKTLQTNCKAKSVDMLKCLLIASWYYITNRTCNHI